MLAASFLFFLAIFAAVGIYAARRAARTNLDYLLAGRSVPAWLTGLSAAATNNSGYMFIGLVGYAYSYGLQAIWLMAGWIAGDFLMSLFVHKRLREKTASEKVLSYGGVLANWYGVPYPVLRAVCGLMTIVLLGMYAAAQLNAGSKALHVLFGWQYAVGAILGAAIVLAYCLAGGIRASIWTDAAQSFVMVLAMATMAFMAIAYSGGWDGFGDALYAVSPDYMQLLPDAQFGALPFILGWLFAGFGIIAQPHVMVRFMAMNSPDDIGRVRLYYYAWYIGFTVLAMLVALGSRIVLPFDAALDAELAMPRMAEALLPPIMTGLVLAGLFAATMSTADSQILSCSAALTRDLPGAQRWQGYWWTKAATVLVTLVALSFSLFGSSQVLLLGIFAWAALSAAFVPLLVTMALGGKLSEKLALIMVACGLACLLAWRFSPYSAAIYAVLPGILGSFVPYLLARWLRPQLLKPAPLFTARR